MITPTLGDWMVALMLTTGRIHQRHFPSVAAQDGLGLKYEVPVAANDNTVGGDAA